jgi:hypothetical protein
VISKRRYAADRAFRQYDAADPANRLVAGELEARWNQALARVAEVESRIVAHQAASPVPALGAAALAFLGADLKTVWSAPTTDARLKKRIVRTLIHEVMADIDDAASEIVIAVHWSGGVHSEIRLPKRRRGQRNSTPADVIAAVRELSLIRQRRSDRWPPQPQWAQDRPRQSLDPRARHLVAFAPSHSSVQSRRRRRRALAQSLGRRSRSEDCVEDAAAGGRGRRDRRSPPFERRSLDLRARRP